MYNLAGLSCAQHRHNYLEDFGKSKEGFPLEAAFGWEVVERGCSNQVWDEEDIVEEVHPVLVVRSDRAVKMRRYFQAKEGF